MDIVHVSPRVDSHAALDYFAQRMTTTMTTQPDSASPSPRSPRREQTVSYADLMKPDEDWRTLANVADRRKIQNRLAQRAYRRNLRNRNEEIKRLQKHVKRLEETQARAQAATPPAEKDVMLSSGVASPGTTTPSDAPIISPADDWRSEYAYYYGTTWAPTPESDHNTFTGPIYSFVDEALSPNLPGLDVTQEHILLQPTSEPSGRNVANSSPSCLQHQGSISGTNKTLSRPSPYNHHELSLSSCPYTVLSSGCLCKLKSSNANTSELTPQRDTRSRQREVVLKSVEITSPPIQQQLPQGLVVEQSDGGNGVTIRLQPTAMDGHARVVVFVIQCDEKAEIGGHYDSHP